MRVSHSPVVVVTWECSSCWQGLKGFLHT
jgi:hypothetical protein